MPIVIPRTGDNSPPVSPLPPEQRDELWKKIVSAWLDKNPDALRAMILADDAEEARRCTA